MTIQAVVALVDWNSQLVNSDVRLLADCITRTRRALDLTVRRVTRALEQQHPSLRYRVNLRLYHGWHRGFQVTENRRAIQRVVAESDIAIFSPSSRVLISSNVQYGDQLLTALDSRLNRRPANLNVDDAVVQGTASSAAIVGASINQFDIRGANLEDVRFEDVSIVTVIANDTTRTHASFPRPATVQFENRSDASELLPDVERIERLIQSGWQTYQERSTTIEMLPREFEKYPLVKLLDRTCRFGQHWIRAKGDVFAERLTQHEKWNELVELLRQHDLVRIEDRRAASGTPSLWYHIRRSSDILARYGGDDQFRGFFQDLRSAVAD